MAIKFKRLYQAFQAYKNSANLGDFALLKADAFYAGEIGVLAFAVSQKYSKLQIISLWIAQVLYPILAPQQFKSILVNLRQGKQMECIPVL